MFIQTFQLQEARAAVSDPVYTGPAKFLNRQVLYLCNSGADLGGGCRGCAPPLPWDDLRFSNTTGILQKKKCGLLVLKWSKRRVRSLLKKILDPPLQLVNTKPCKFCYRLQHCLHESAQICRPLKNLHGGSTSPMWTKESTDPCKFLSVLVNGISVSLFLLSSVMS